MPTIDLSNQQPQVSSSNPVASSIIPPNFPPKTQSGGWDSPWNDPPQQSALKRQSPQERLAMIEKIYTNILGRKPDTRDINYYKYSTLSEEEIVEQLLSGNEHLQLISDGREYKRLKERALQAETRVKLLEGQIRDQVEEFRQLTNLLSEKNNHIKQLRDKVNEVYKTNPFHDVPEIPQTPIKDPIPDIKQKSVSDKLRHVLRKFV